MTSLPTLRSTALSPVHLEITPPGPLYAGVKTATPFTLSLSSDIPGPLTIELYAEGSRSAPPGATRDKWAHLVPQWRFLNAAGDPISEIIVDTQQVSTYAYTASGEFFFIDDLSTVGAASIIIWAVVDFSKYPAQIDNRAVEGFANSKVYTATPLKVNWLPPTHLTVTRDGINPLFPLYWKDAINHYIITVNATAPATTATDLSYNAYPIMFDVPASNTLSGVIFRDLVSATDVLSASWMYDLTSIQMSATDHYGFSIAGYVRDTFKRGQAGTSLTVCASSVIDYAVVNTEPYTGSLWISNPLSNTINNVYVPTSVGAEYVGPSISSVADQVIIDTTALQVASATSVMSVTGFGGIYGIGVDSSRLVWATDAENDRVYKFDTVGNLLSTLDQPQGSTPAGIAIDSQDDVWVTFFDSESVIKIDGQNGATLATIQYGYPSPTLDALYSTGSADPIFKPVGVETDSMDNVWIVYTNTYYSELQKFNSSGASITTVSLSLCANPVDVKVDTDDSVWITLNSNAGPSFDNSGEVLKYDTTGNLLSTFSGFTLPSYIAVSTFGDVWVTHGWNEVTRITPSGSVYTFTVGPGIPTALAPGDKLEHTALGGITVDELNRVWVINSFNNTLYLTTSTGAVSGVVVTPVTQTAFYNVDGYTVTGVDVFAQSAQAFGDWSGAQWQRKYNTISTLTSAISTAYIQGCSTPFSLRDGEQLGVRRFNESWKAGKAIQEYAISPHIRDNSTFWDVYMNSVWGTDSSSEGAAFGRQGFERIANFTANHADINTCGVKGLYSLAGATDVPIDQYEINTPPVVTRLLDIASINQQVLWGTRDACGQNITNEYKTYISGGQFIDELSRCEVCGQLSPGNKGPLFDPRTYSVTAGVPFIVRDKYRYGEHTLITPPVSSVSIASTGGPCDINTISFNTLTEYPLISAYHWLLPTIFDVSNEPSLNEFLENAGRYCFYSYMNVSSKAQVAGVINWDDPFTTYTENASSVQEWYGDFGALEQMFSYELHKGLGLIDE